MPRAIWTGTISFGLVNVPMRMHSAIEEKDSRSSRRLTKRSLDQLDL